MMCVLLAGKISYKWGSQLWFIGQYANAIDVLLISVRQLKICAAHEAKNLNMQMQVGHWYHIFWPRISLRLVSSESSFNNAATKCSFLCFALWLGNINLFICMD